MVSARRSAARTTGCVSRRTLEGLGITCRTSRGRAWMTDSGTKQRGDPLPHVLPVPLEGTGDVLEDVALRRDEPGLGELLGAELLRGGAIGVEGHREVLGLPLPE